MKKTTLFIGLSILGLASFGFSKFNGIKNIIDSLKINLDKINNVDFSSEGVMLDISLALVNNSTFGTSLTKLITLKEIKIINDAGNVLAVSNPDIKGIVLEPSQTLVIDNIEVFGTYSSAIDEYFSTQFRGQYKIEAIIEVLGRSWVIS